MAYCPNCGTEAEPSFNYCSVCGRDLTGRSSTATAQQVPQGLPSTLDYHISVRRILIMSVLSHGLYLFYWFFLTWKQYRDHTGNPVFPVWHAMTLMVPVYSLFRTHAHMRTYKELMLDAGVHSTINVGMIVGLVFTSSVLDTVSFNLGGGFAGSAEISTGTAAARLAINLVSVAIVSGLLLHLQGNLNRYWHSLESATIVDVKIGFSEVFLVFIGVFLWIDTIATLVNPAYLAGL